MNKVEQEARTKHAKPRMSLLPGRSLVAVARVLTFGASKYADASWKAAPFKAEDYHNALLRHMAAISDGEIRDPESGLLHAAHAACNALMYLWYVLETEQESSP